MSSLKLNKKTKLGLVVVGVVIIVIVTLVLMKLLLSNQKPQLQYVEVPEFPVVSIEGIDENMTLTVPDMEYISESKGNIEEYYIQDNSIYYIVSYDSYYFEFYKQIAVFKQSLEETSVTKLAEIYLDNGVNIIDVFYENELAWRQVDELNNEYICKVIDGKVEVTSLEEGLEDTNIQELVKGYDIEDKYLQDNTFVTDFSDEAVVWQQWPKLTEDCDTYYGSTTNVLNKKTKTFYSFENESYGIVYAPVLVGNWLYFLTDDDIKSYDSSDDFYGNVYMVNIENSKEIRLTDNYGSEQSLETIIYDEPKRNEDLVYFLSTKVTESESQYQYVYYIK